MRGDNKALANWLHGLNPKQVFFGVWALIVGACILGMMSYYRRYTRRNFRGPSDPRAAVPIVDLRTLGPNERKTPVAGAAGEEKKRKG